MIYLFVQFFCSDTIIIFSLTVVYNTINWSDHSTSARKTHMTKISDLLSPISKNKLHNEIAGQIQKKIIKGELKVGEKLPPERELAIGFNVNRGTVREALKKLEVIGLVEIKHGDGIYIKNYLESGNLELLKTLVFIDNGINIEVLKNLLEMRKIIAPDMASFAAEKRTEQELEELHSLVFSRNDIPIEKKDFMVHHLIARASKNILYIFILNFFNQLFEDYGYLYFSNESNNKRSDNFHKDIYESIKASNSTLARDLMKDVLIYTENEIYKNLRIT